jgi:hypothetical protein
MAATSDHNPILLTWNDVQNNQCRQGGFRPFRYEVMWERHEDFDTMLRNVWTQQGKASTLIDLQRKIESVTGSLQRWGNNTFGNVRKEIFTLRDELKRMREEPGRVGPSQAEQKTVERLIELDHREEVMWRQRSRVQWLAEGDKNTRFFHLRASQRKRRNKICQLRRADGEMTDDPSVMASATNEFYCELYRSEGVEEMNAVLDTVPARVTGEMNEALIASITSQEVRDALFQMFPTKAPGLMGCPPIFSSVIGVCVGRRLQTLC